MIDQPKKKALIEHIKELQTSNEREILLAPDLYFDGYDDEHCTVCANVGPFSTSHFAARLREVRQRADVSAVFVRFYDYADAEEFEDSWVGSDSVYVITSASLETVRDWFTNLEVTEVWEESDVTKFPDAPKIPDGFRLVAVWWD
jgi:hypothetical protein